MVFLLLTLCLSKVSDSDPLITQEMVDKINSDPKSTYKAKLYPKFAKMKISDAKRFLSPVRPSPKKSGSAHPVGTNENYFHGIDTQVISGLTERKMRDWGIWEDDNVHHALGTGTYKVPIYDVGMLCSSWAPAVTSAISYSVSRWAGTFVNFSLQFVLDCDLLGDPCVERPSLAAYSIFWSSKGRVPQYSRWDKAELGGRERTSPLQAPRSTLTNAICQSPSGCYPGLKSCSRSWALSGSCSPGESSSSCPVYFLYNWRWMKSHLFEVGAITSSILVRSSLFTYSDGVYSTKGDTADVLGMLDVTIIGWGQTQVNLSTNASAYSKDKERWWWVIPHFGCDFGLPISSISKDNSTDLIGIGSYLEPTGSNCDGMSEPKGIMKFNRRFDDSLIESQAVGAVPYNFVPLPIRTPEQTVIPATPKQTA